MADLSTLDLTGGVCDWLANGAGMGALLDEHAGAPAVFTPLKPAGYEYKELPAAIVRRPTLFDDKKPFAGEDAADALLQVAFYCRYPANSTDDRLLNAAVMKARKLFQDGRFVDTNGIRYQSRVSGPLDAPVSSIELTGAILQLRLFIGG